jgi:hypothetical protein
MSRLFDLEENEEVKECMYCKATLHISNFWRHSHNKDNLDNRCKKCMNYHSRLRDKLKRTAPPRPKHCECCGCEPEKWALDHDHLTEDFRGWLCYACNVSLGNFGDTIEGLMKAVNYLKRYEKRKKERNDPSKGLFNS